MAQIRRWSADGSLGAPRRSAEEARELLQNATSSPTVDLYPRSDGPGSSQDLPQFAAMGNRVACSKVDLQDPSWSWSCGCLRTPGVCVDGAPIRYRAVPADDPQAYEYYAPDFHQRPVACKEVVPGTPGNFINNILCQFRLHGIRIEADPMPVVYRGTGLGGSNLAHAAGLALASALSGMDLSLAQIYILATQLENYFGVREIAPGQLEYGVSLTGGQETLTAFQGGFWDNVHIPFSCGPYSVMSRELIEPEYYGEVEQHLALINIGQRRGKGVTSSGVNHVWMSAWGNVDGARRHLQKAEIAYQAAEALRHRDWEAYCNAVKAYREIRAGLCADYLAGQKELADLCNRYTAEYFPLGGGSGTCLVAAADSSALKEILARLEETGDPERGRASLPLRIRQKGVTFHHFEAAGLNVPAPPESL